MQRHEVLEVLFVPWGLEFGTTTLHKIIEAPPGQYDANVQAAHESVP